MAELTNVYGWTEKCMAELKVYGRMGVWQSQTNLIQSISNLKTVNMFTNLKLTGSLKVAPVAFSLHPFSVCCRLAAEGQTTSGKRKLHLTMTRCWCMLHAKRSGLSNLVSIEYWLKWQFSQHTQYWCIEQPLWVAVKTRSLTLLTMHDHWTVTTAQIRSLSIFNVIWCNELLQFLSVSSVLIFLVPWVNCPVPNLCSAVCLAQLPSFQEILY